MFPPIYMSKALRKVVSEMDTNRIKEIHQKTAFPNSISVQQALLQVWNECEQQHIQERDRLRSKVKELEYDAQKRNNALQRAKDAVKRRTARVKELEGALEDEIEFWRGRERVLDVRNIESNVAQVKVSCLTKVLEGE